MFIKDHIKNVIDLNAIEITKTKTKITEPMPKQPIQYNFEYFRNSIISTFETQSKKKFINNIENIKKVDVLASYLARDNRFFTSPLLNKDINSPSFKKGLLIVGDYGVGKSALLKTIPVISSGYFTYDLTVDLVSEFESLSSSDKSQFMNKHKFGRRIYDDLGTEKIASNYGLVNLMKDVFESRYGVENVLTMAACNYDENDPLDLDAALLKLGEKYGGRVLDRLYEMFNFVEFTGKSLR